jgi:Na+/H+ antiporter NhaC
LGIGTAAYLPFCFFSILNPLLTIAVAFLGIRMLPLRSSDASTV